MFDYFYAVFKNMLPVLNVCPSSCVTAQIVGYHLVYSAPFSNKYFFLYAISIRTWGWNCYHNHVTIGVVNSIFLDRNRHLWWQDKRE
jgi:hypothetical protein